MTTFTYLLDIAGTGHDHLAKAASVFAQLKRVWTAECLLLKLKTMMYNTLVRPVAPYGAETWTLIPSHELHKCAGSGNSLKSLPGNTYPTRRYAELDVKSHLVRCAAKVGCAASAICVASQPPELRA